MFVIPDTILEMLMPKPSSFFDNHKEVKLSDYKHVHYLGNINLNSSYPSQTEHVYVATLSEPDFGFKYSSHTNNHYHLIVINSHTLDSINKDEDLDFLTDYDLSLFKNILNTWTSDEIKLQVIFT
jgi:hypothetical protein